MKITLEHIDNIEPEITIKGDITNKNIQHILSMLKSNNVSSKIILYIDETELFTDISDIIYFEVQDRKTFATTDKQKYLCKQTLTDILLLFNNHGITQISKSVLVNVHHVSALNAEFSGNYIATLDNGEKLLVSRFYMKTFRNAIMEI